MRIFISVKMHILISRILFEYDEFCVVTKKERCIFRASAHVGAFFICIRSKKGCCNTLLHTQGRKEGNGILILFPFFFIKEIPKKHIIGFQAAEPPLQCTRREVPKGTPSYDVKESSRWEEKSRQMYKRHPQGLPEGVLWGRRVVTFAHITAF